jgi:hypothetical protein
MKGWELEQKAAALAGPIVQRRLSVLTECFGNPLDIATANGLLRQAAEGVTVDYLGGELLVDWHHGGQSRIRYTLPGTGAFNPAELSGRGSVIATKWWAERSSRVAKTTIFATGTRRKAIFATLRFGKPI